DIYREIKSNSRAVAACIRSYERDRKSASSASGKGSLTPEIEASFGSSNSTTSGHNNSNSVADGKGKENGGGGVKGLERRYHLLYLKAFEIQCLLEGLLDSKTSSSDNNASLSDTDEEPANKLARVSSSSIKSPGSNHNDTLSNEEWVKVKKLSNAGFDADSEGSDSEIVPKIIAYSGVANNAYNNSSESSSQKQEAQYHPGTGSSSISSAVASTSSPSSGNLMMEADIHNLSSTTTLSDATTLTTTSSKAAEAANAATVLKENILNNNNNTTIESEKSLIGCDLVDGTALLSSTLDTVNNNNASVNDTALVKEHNSNERNGVGKGSSLSNVKSSSPIGSSGKQKRSKVSDTSKFNRSNRKSKNCATFYFKHLDTDSELNKDSSERTKSDESSPGTSSPSASSSEGDDEWVYNNGAEEEEEVDEDELLAVRKRTVEAGEEEKENKPDQETASVDKQQREELGTSALKMTAGREPKSKKCLDFSRDASQKGGAATPNGRNGARSLMMTSIGSFGKGSDGVNGTRGSKPSQYATSSIQRLVLHAETLVRDEILAKNAAAAAAGAAGGTTPKTVLKNPHYYHHHHHHHHHNYSANNSSSNNSNSSHHQQPGLLSALPGGVGGIAASLIASHEPPSSRHGATAHSQQHHHHHHHHGHGRKAEKVMSNLKKNLIEEWLEKQPLDARETASLLPVSVPTTDCEASGEYTDSDSIARDTDSSEGLANSVATCLQGEQTQTSQELLNDGTSYPSENSNDDEGVATDSKGGSSNAMTTSASTAAGGTACGGVTAASSSPSLSTSGVHHGTGSVSTVVKRRPHRSATDRPWSVSCMSQLNSSSVEINQYGGVGGVSGTSGQDSGSGGGGGTADPTGPHKQNGGTGSSGGDGAGDGNDSNRPLTDHRNFSISESALNTMAGRGASGSGSSMVGSRGSMKPTSSQQTVVRNSESKGSLKKRKLRPRRKNRIDESGSDESQPPHHSSSTLHLLQQSLLLQYNALAAGTGQPLREIQLSGTGGSNSSVAGGAITTSSSRRLLKSESFSGRLRLSDDLLTLSSLSGSSSRKSSSVRPSPGASRSPSKRSQDSEEEFGCQMAKPEFRIGSLTRTRCGSLNLGSLAALANYNLDGVEKTEADLNGTGTGTEEMSSFSEQAWDNYQEKYMSEPYSEDRDTDGARRLLDFGDDYRNFIDSQSDCASSSLSAANMDSLSPPRFRLKSESANKSDVNTNSLNRRKRLDEYRMDDRYGNNMNSWSSKSGSPPQSTGGNVSGGRKLGSLSFLEATPLAPMAESSVNGSGLNGGTTSGVRRRSLRSVDKHNTSAAFVRSLSHETSSSSNNEFDEDMEAEVKKLLIQSKIRFAHTEALKAKCHLLKPDDYSEIITTCRENVRCLESVLRCQPGTVLTAAKCQDLRGKRMMHQRAQTTSSTSSPTAQENQYKEGTEDEDEYDSDYSEDGSESDGDSTISCSDRSTDSTTSTLGRRSEIGAACQQQQPWSRCAGQRGGKAAGACRRQVSTGDRNVSDRGVNGRQEGGSKVEQLQENELLLLQPAIRNDRGRLVRRPRKKVIVVREECRCARITRFIAWLIDFLLDISNVVRNFTLYRFFVGVLNGFYRLVDFFGRGDRTTNAQPVADTAATASAVGSGSESGVGSLTSASATFATTKALARDTIVCWEGLLNWSERRVISNQFLDDIRALKDVLEELGSKTFNICSESHIQLAIDQLKNEHKVLQNQRPKMLTLNATVHNWVSNQEQQRKELLDPSVDARLEQLERDKNFERCIGGHCGECYDCLNDIRLDTSVNRELKYGITTLYSTWDEAEVRLRNRIENLTTSMMTWKQLEDGLSDFRNTLDRDRGKLQGIEGALQSGGGTTEEIVNSVKEVVKALSEKVDPLFQEQQQNGAIETGQSAPENLQLLAPALVPACVKLSSNGSLSDSGISDGGGMSDGSLSERERRLNALKRLVKQLEVALAPGSDAMQTITKRLEMAEHDLRSLQSTCRKIIMNEKNQQEQQQQQQQQLVQAKERSSGADSADGNNNVSVSVKNKNKKSPSRKKHRNGAKNRSQSNTSAEVTENEDDEHLLQQQQLQQQQEELQREHLLAMQKSSQLGIVQTTKMKLSQNRWVWRITKIAVPVQLALVLVMCAACFFEPHCCDALNTYSMSLTPQLRYMKGPPPI
uniref:KASH domain-containing protein n=1 Tax=Anopheles epiroticus TaxID=199890 RepID=A0A182P2S4_9DIPT